MKYLVFVICCLTLAYAEEVKLGLQMLSTTNGRTSQRFNSPSGGRVAQQRLANGNGFSNFRPATSPSSNGNGFSNFRPATSPSSNGNGFSNIRQTRAAFPASFAGPYGTNYAGENFVGQFGRYNPMFVGQVSWHTAFIAIPFLSVYCYSLFKSIILFMPFILFSNFQTEPPF